METGDGEGFAVGRPPRPGDGTSVVSVSSRNNRLRRQVGSFLKVISAIVRATCRTLFCRFPRRSPTQSEEDTGRRARAEATLLRSQRLGLGRGGSICGLTRVGLAFSRLNRAKHLLVGVCTHPGRAGRVSLGTAALCVVASPRPAAGYFFVSIASQLANSLCF